MSKFSCKYLNKDFLTAEKRGLIFAIRTDARHATKELKSSLKDHLSQGKTSDIFQLSANQKSASRTSLDQYIEDNVHAAYQEWGRSVLTSMSECLDYEKYGLADPKDHQLHVHFYNAQDLADQAILDAYTISPKDRNNTILISLDDMIESDDAEISEIAFSRLFSLDGKKQFDYVARPGRKPIDVQMAAILKEAQSKHRWHGEKPSIILLEDNVRHAKMLNWLIEKMDDAGILEHANLDGISTCFCCASNEEKRKIQHKGKTIPVSDVVDYGETKVDVSTPRDLLFDGLVVEVDGKHGRLPGVFMDLEARFKINPNKVEQFKIEVTKANINFCKTLEKNLGVKIPLDWFVISKPVAHVTQLCHTTSMTIVLECPARI